MSLTPASNAESDSPHAATNLARLPEPLRHLQEPHVYPVEIAVVLHRLAEQVDQESSKP